MYKFNDVNLVLTNFDKTPLLYEDGLPLTLKKVLTKHLGSYQGRDVDGEALMRAYILGMKVQESTKELELDDDQIIFLKKVLAATPVFIAVVAGQLLSLIDSCKIKAETAPAS